MNKELKEKIDEVVKSLHKNGARHEETDRLTKEMFAIPATPEEKHEAGQYLREAMHKRKREDVDSQDVLDESSDTGIFHQ